MEGEYEPGTIGLGRSGCGGSIGLELGLGTNNLIVVGVGSGAMGVIGVAEWHELR